MLQIEDLKINKNKTANFELPFRKRRRTIIINNSAPINIKANFRKTIFSPRRA
jgi:hypothetical protein